MAPSVARSAPRATVFSRNSDANVSEYHTKYGIYKPNCGLENIHMSFGHDGYIAEVMKPYLSDEALYMCAALQEDRFDPNRGVGMSRRRPAVVAVAGALLACALAAGPASAASKPPHR